MIRVRSDSVCLAGRVLLLSVALIVATDSSTPAIAQDDPATPVTEEVRVNLVQVPLLARARGTGVEAHARRGLGQTDATAIVAD